MNNMYYFIVFFSLSNLYSMQENSRWEIITSIDNQSFIYEGNELYLYGHLVKMAFSDNTYSFKNVPVFNYDEHENKFTKQGKIENLRLSTRQDINNGKIAWTYVKNFKNQSNQGDVKSTLLGALFLEIADREQVTNYINQHFISEKS